jgi:hypothetical protein
LETPLPTGAAPAWDALDAEQRARVVSMLARLIARAAVEPAGTADEEKSDE